MLRRSVDRRDRFTESGSGRSARRCGNRVSLLTGVSSSYRCMTGSEILLVSMGSELFLEELFVGVVCGRCVEVD